MSIDWSFLFTAELMKRFGWVLLHSIWQIALVAVLFSLTVRVLVRHSSASRYLAGCMALCMMLGIPAATFLTLSSFPQLNSHFPEMLTDAELDKLHSQRSMKNQNSGDHLLNSTPSNREKRRIASQPLIKTADGSRLAASPALQESVSWRIELFFPTIVIFWFVGVSVMICRPLLGFMTTLRMRTDGILAAPEFVHSLTQQLKNKMGLNQPVEVVESMLASVPCVIGVFYPIILLPSSVITMLPPDQLVAIIAHELAHIRRNDFFVNILQTFVEALLFYHPMVWWVSRQVRQERENCCDDAAIVASGNRLNYAQALFAVDQLRGGYSQLSMSVTGESVVSRIQRLKGEPTRRGYGLDVCCSVIFLALGLTLAHAVEPITTETSRRDTVAVGDREDVLETTIPSLVTFDRIVIDFPDESRSQSHRLEIASDSSYCFSLIGLLTKDDQRPTIYCRRGVLSSESLIHVSRCLDIDQVVENFQPKESIGDGSSKCSELSVRLKSGAIFSMEIGRQEVGSPYENLIDFLRNMIDDELKKLPHIPWEQYTQERYEEAVAAKRPILQYLIKPKFSNVRRPSLCQLPETIRLLKKHDVVCLNEHGSSPDEKVIWKGLPPSKFPNGLFSLSLYLPKSGRIVSISNDQPATLSAVLKRTLEGTSEDGLVDIGGSDFSIFSPYVSTQIGNLKFTVITETDWVLPEKKGDRRMLPIHFRMQSAVGKEVYFPRVGTHFPVLEDSKGNVYRYEGAKSGDRPSDRRIQGLGHSTFKFFSFFEKDKETGEVFFYFRRGFRKVSRLGPIEPGNYHLHFELQSCPFSDEQRNGKRPDNLWSGHGSTWAVPITVHNCAKVTRPRMGTQNYEI